MSTPDQEIIRTLIENWALAVRQKNLTGIIAQHSPDIVMFDVPPPLQSKGIDAYRATWALFFSSATEPVAFDILEMDVTAGSDVAFATAIMRCVESTDGELIFRLTVGLRKVSGQWLVTHEHHSLPAT